MRGRVDNKTHGSVVSQGHQMASGCVPGVPRTKRRGHFVREEDIVLGVIEDGLGLMFLFAGRSGSGVRDETPASAQLPQFDQGIFPGGKKVLTVPGEHN